MHVLETIIKYIALAVYFCYPVVILIYIPLAISIDENKYDDSIKAQILRGLFYASCIAMVILMLYAKVVILYTT